MRTKDNRMEVERRGEWIQKMRCKNTNWCIFTSIYVLDAQCHGMKKIKKEKRKSREGEHLPCWPTKTQKTQSCKAQNKRTNITKVRNEGAERFVLPFPFILIL
jgi:hypothetical protein